MIHTKYLCCTHNHYNLQYLYLYFLPASQDCIQAEDKVCGVHSENHTGVTFIVSLGIYFGHLREHISRSSTFTMYMYNQTTVNMQYHIPENTHQEQCMIPDTKVLHTVDAIHKNTPKHCTDNLHQVNKPCWDAIMNRFNCCPVKT